MRGLFVKVRLRPDIEDKDSGGRYGCFTGEGLDSSLERLYLGDPVLAVENSNPIVKGDEGTILGFSEDGDSVIVDFGEPVGVRSLDPALVRKIRRQRRRR